MTEQQIKAAVRQRDGNQCAECGMTNEQHLKTFKRQLEVHRLIPGSAYALDDSCVSLCRICHYPKPKSERSEHQATMLARLFRSDMVHQLGLLVELMGTDAISEIRNAMRERLQQFKLWPPSK